MMNESMWLFHYQLQCCRQSLILRGYAGVKVEIGLRFEGNYCKMSNLCSLLSGDVSIIVTPTILG